MNSWGLAVVTIAITIVSCSKPTPLIVADDGPAPAPAAADENETFLNGFIGDLNANKPDLAYAKMAPTYRESNTLDQFKAQVTASPYLSSATHVSVVKTQNDAIVAEAWLDTSRGKYNLGAFISKEGGAKRVLVLSIAGVPVLQGVTKH